MCKWWRKHLVTEFSKTHYKECALKWQKIWNNTSNTIWAASSEEVPLNVHKMCWFRSLYACLKYHLGFCFSFILGWFGEAKVSWILHHWGIQLILAYSWARPAVLAAGKGTVGMFLFLLFLLFHSCSSFFPVPLFHLLYYLFYLFSPFLWMTQYDLQGLMCR